MAHERVRSGVALSEFALIERLRRRLAAARDDVALGIGDDAALLNVPPGQQLVACTDTMVEGVHFLPGAPPSDLGWKALAVNLSDLAAMGGAPAWALLALTLPNDDAGFIERFADGFGELAHRHGVALVGGDTTQGPLAVTVTALGLVPHARALPRAGARAGDAVFVTGTLGAGAGALTLVRRGQTPGPALAERMRRPVPRLAAGLALRGLASACIDVSDGLLADLGHICTASGVGAEVDADALPVLDALRAAFDADDCRSLALAGGDDYELCFTVPAERAGGVARAFAGLDVAATRIGRIVAGAGVRALDSSGALVKVPHPGWEHFQ